MSTPIWPVSHMAYPLEHTLDVDAIVNDYGGGYEQRIVTDIARSRANGIGGTSTYVGRNRFRIGIPRLQTTDAAAAGTIDNSITALWTFYRDRFYSATDGVKWEAFYWYNPYEQPTTSNWDGVVTVGRYLVRFAQPSLTRTHFVYCLASFDLELVEVVA